MSRYNHILRCSPPLSREEEVFLFTQLATARRTIEVLGAKRQKRTAQESSQLGIARQVTRETRARLSEANTPYVLKMAKRFTLPGVELDDLIGDGVHKLLQCMDNFDVARGIRFSTYLHRALFLLYMRKRCAENRTWQKRVVDEDDNNSILTNHPAPEKEDDDLVELREVLAKNRAKLSRVEMKIIRLTLEKTPAEITMIMGLSKSQQLEYYESAIKKLGEVMR